ncbi:neck protein [Escherichia phage vB_EcoM_005]|uniref:Neck protein n=1 Tax=Escherichia phage vB_EcoM_005 TaxID=2500761 RepID=A0A3Q9R967_9CAUD|nr:neck protein [Escherichia phage vB_EcoM_005]AZV00955.1 neck protein [Escherichia phage vB_EcoM_005]
MVGNTAGYGYASGGCDENEWSPGAIWDNPARRISGMRAGEDLGLQDGSYNNRWVKDYATALVKEVNGNILLPDYWYNDATEQLKVMGNFVKGDFIVIEVYTRSFNGVDSMVGNTAGYGYASGGCDENEWSPGAVWDNPSRRISGMRVGEDLGLQDWCI